NPFEAVETIFRRVLARTDTKISRGAFGGQHFRRQQQEASRGDANLALYVAGNLLFKYAISGRWQLSHLVGLSLFALAALLARDTSPLVLGALATSVLIVVAGWETRSIGDRARH